MKSKKSGWIKKKTKKYPKGVLWVRDYSISTVVVNEEFANRHVHNQSHH